MINISGVSLSYTKGRNQRVNVLNNISLEVRRGEIFGVIGKSGAGKSTLLKCINLLERPQQGQIVVDGVDLTKISKQELRVCRQKIGMIFQGFNLLNSKTVFNNVALPLVLNGGYTQEQIKEKVTNLLNIVGLGDFYDKYPQNLSGGQKQRVGIARALATDPKILLSDEATSALDSETTNSILELLLDINEKLGVTIFMITHEIDVVRKICDRVAVIDSGKVVECGRTVDIVLHPSSELTRKLIIEEESVKYLEQVRDFYKFDKTNCNYLILLSFIGNSTFDPVLSQISQGSGITFSILRGELGRIKKMPFGQLLLEINGTPEQLEKAISIIKNLDLHYEIIA